MALTIETGDIVENADSYLSLVAARVLAVSYGYTLPADDTAAEIALRKAASYVDSFEQRFTGYRVSELQSLSFPRQAASYSYGGYIDDNVIPVKLQLAQVIAAATYGAGTAVRPNDSGQAVASTTLDKLSKSYFNNGSTSKQITITECVDALRTLFSSSSSNKFSFDVTRG
jgi:hypothetical protein